MRYGDWIPTIVLAALLAALVGLSVETVSDPPRFDEPGGAEALTGREIEAVLVAAFEASLGDAPGHPGTPMPLATVAARQ